MPPLKVRAARAVAIAVVLQALFVFFFLTPAHDPQPNGLPVAVVGQASVPKAPDQGDLDVVQVATVAEAEALIRDREVYGAVAADQVLVASAASAPAAQLIAGVGGATAGGPVRDIVPLAEDDPRGVTLNVLVLPLIITSILLALVTGGLIPDMPVRGRVGVFGVVGLLGATAVIALSNWWLGALPGPWLAEIGVIALAVIAIGLASAGIVRLVGPAGTALPFLLFLMLGSPASGLASAPELLPTPWAEFGQFLPPGALGSALRGTAYFDGAAVLGPLAVLVVWGLLGLALNVLADRKGLRPDV